jgi:hypothetical protein
LLLLIGYVRIFIGALFPESEFGRKAYRSRKPVGHLETPDQPEEKTETYLQPSLPVPLGLPVTILEWLVLSGPPDGY